MPSTGERARPGWFGPEAADRSIVSGVKRAALDRAEVARLQQAQGYPAVSILMPTGTTPQSDRARLAGLFDVVATRLLGEFPRHAVQRLLDDLEALGTRDDLPWGHESLALFVSKQNAVAVALPILVRERVVIDETFATRDLVHAALRSPVYRVLVLGKRLTRLYAGLGRILTEVTHDDFPLLGADEARDNARERRSRFGVDRSALRDNQLHRYVRVVDASLAPYMRDELPLIVVGAGRRLPAFRLHSRHRRHITTTLSGTFGQQPGDPGTVELADLVWPAVCEVLARRHQEALGELDRALGSRRCAAGVEEVWALAPAGRGTLLVVEESFEYSARVEFETNRPLHADDVEHPEVIDDMVDEIIEIVLAKRGRVAIVPDGALADLGRIAMALRY
ncbi:MAG: hypothetical protein SGJ13_05785 [Actinomycetota bacterium]|nr:hypothetical protein [Actinomycetota bacterium]